MKNERKIILLAVFMSIFGATFCSAVKADLTFGEISVSPLSPAAQSTITISIPISGETPSEVKVRIEECNGRSGICFSDVQNVSMPLISMGNYQTSVTLRHAEATYFNCTVLAKINGTWTPPAKWKWKIVNLSENSNGNTNGNGNDGNGIPGFELVLVVIAIGLSLIVTGRKRAK
jgi:hypothetical protein